MLAKNDHGLEANEHSLSQLSATQEASLGPTSTLPERSRTTAWVMEFPLASLRVPSSPQLSCGSRSPPSTESASAMSRITAGWTEWWRSTGMSLSLRWETEALYSTTLYNTTGFCVVGNNGIFKLGADGSVVLCVRSSPLARARADVWSSLFVRKQACKLPRPHQVHVDTRSSGRPAGQVHVQRPIFDSLGGENVKYRKYCSHGRGRANPVIACLWCE